MDLYWLQWNMRLSRGRRTSSWRLSTNLHGCGAGTELQGGASIRDTEHPAHYVETFIVESWAEHLRQHERLTRGDRDLEENVRRFEWKPTRVRHFIYARSKPGRH